MNQINPVNPQNDLRYEEVVANSLENRNYKELNENVAPADDIVSDNISIKENIDSKLTLDPNSGVSVEIKRNRSF